MIDFFEYSNEMLCIADSRGYFTRVNQAWTKTLGWSAEELTSRPYFDFVHPDDLEATRREASLLLVGMHETVRFENRYRCPDGSYRWLAWQAILEAGTGTLVASARDVTVQKAQTEALRSAEARFRAFMDHIPAVAWSNDESGRIVYLNKACEEYLHLGTEDWQGKTPFDFWPPEVAARFQANSRKVIESGLPFKHLEETAGRERAHCYWMTILFPYKDGLEQTYVGGIAIDISELKRTEDALKARQDLLRSLIDVQENEKQRLCHEFHDGLIQYAVGTMMLLESYQRSHPSAKDSTIIDTAIANLRKGIEDGRRTIRGIRPAVLDDLDLNAAIQDLVDQFSNSGTMVTYTCDPELGRLSESVQTTIYRVAQEALNNARKYSGTDVIRIALKKVDGDVQLEVRDFGCGFDVAKARSRGFGLLGMTERVRLLGGECIVESEHDVGTRVEVRLPISAADVDDDLAKPVTPAG